MALIQRLHQPVNCSQAMISETTQSAISKNLAYTAELNLQKTDAVDSSPSITLRMSLDLSSQWSWVKSSICKSCENSLKIDQCRTYNQSRAVNCQGYCKLISKCGLILAQDAALQLSG